MCGTQRTRAWAHDKEPHHHRRGREGQYKLVQSRRLARTEVHHNGRNNGYSPRCWSWWVVVGTWWVRGGCVVGTRWVRGGYVVGTWCVVGCGGYVYVAGRGGSWWVVVGSGAARLRGRAAVILSHWDSEVASSLFQSFAKKKFCI